MQQLQKFLDRLSKQAEGAGNSSSDNSSAHQDVVKDIVAQVGNVIKEANEGIKRIPFRDQCLVAKERKLVWMRTIT